MVLTILLFFAFLMAFVFLSRFLRRGKAVSSSKYRATPFFSRAESLFFASLNSRYQGKALVFSKVRLADLAQPAEAPYTSSWHTAFNRISAKHVDFLLCRLDHKPFCVVELDDSSHALSNRRDRDEFVDQVLKAAGLPVFHIPVRSSYSSTDFKGIDTLL